MRGRKLLMGKALGRDHEGVSGWMGRGLRAFNEFCLGSVVFGEHFRPVDDFTRQWNGLVFLPLLV